MDDFINSLKKNLEQYEQRLRDLAKPPEFLHSSFLDTDMEFLNPENRADSAKNLIKDLIENMNAWSANRVQGSYSINLVMPDGRYMIVTELHPLGYQGFSAVGFVDGAECRVNGHIHNLIIIGVALSESPRVGYRTGGATTNQPAA